MEQCTPLPSLLKSSHKSVCLQCAGPEYSFDWFRSQAVDLASLPACCRLRASCKHLRADWPCACPADASAAALLPAPAGDPFHEDSALLRPALEAAACSSTGEACTAHQKHSALLRVTSKAAACSSYGFCSAHADPNFTIASTQMLPRSWQHLSVQGF